MTDTTQITQSRAAEAKAGVRLSGGKLKHAALGLAVIAGVFAGVGYGRDYWTNGRYLVSTDDAYVDVHSALISPRSPVTSPMFRSTTTNASRQAT